MSKSENTVKKWYEVELPEGESLEFPYWQVGARLVRLLITGANSDWTKLNRVFRDVSSHSTQSDSQSAYLTPTAIRSLQYVLSGVKLPDTGDIKAYAYVSGYSEGMVKKFVTEEKHKPEPAYVAPKFRDARGEFNFVTQDSRAPYSAVYLQSVFEDAREEGHIDYATTSKLAERIARVVGMSRSKSVTNWLIGNKFIPVYMRFVLAHFYPWVQLPVLIYCARLDSVVGRRRKARSKHSEPVPPRMRRLAKQPERTGARRWMSNRERYDLGARVIEMSKDTGRLQPAAKTLAEETRHGYSTITRARRYTEAIDTLCELYRGESSYDRKSVVRILLLPDTDLSVAAAISIADDAKLNSKHARHELSAKLGRSARSALRKIEGVRGVGRVRKHKTTRKPSASASEVETPCYSRAFAKVIAEETRDTLLPFIESELEGVVKGIAKSFDQNFKALISAITSEDTSAIPDSDNVEDCQHVWRRNLDQWGSESLRAEDVDEALTLYECVKCGVLKHSSDLMEDPDGYRPCDPIATFVGSLPSDADIKLETRLNFRRVYVDTYNEWWVAFCAEPSK